MDAVDNAEFRRRVQPVAWLLRRTADEAQEVGEARSWNPTETSVAYDEWRKYRARAAFSGALTLLNAARDHMHAAAEVIGSDRVYVWATMALGRSTIEVRPACGGSASRTSTRTTGSVAATNSGAAPSETPTGYRI